MVQNLTSTIVASATEAASTGTIIAAIALLITLLGVVYKFGQYTGKMEKLEQVVEAKLESIEEKYNTSEKIQNVELKIQKMESKIELKSNIDDVNRHVGEITDHLSKLDEEIKALKKRGNEIDFDWINSRLNINEIKNFIQERGLLQNLLYYDRLEQQVTLQKDNWNIELKEYTILDKNVTPLQVSLVFGVSIENGIIIKKEGTSHIDNIRIELIGKIIESKLSIIPYSSAIYYEEI